MSTRKIQSRQCHTSLSVRVTNSITLKSNKIVSFVKAEYKSRQKNSLIKNTHDQFNVSPAVGYPAPMVDTAFAELSQKRACPHGTNANPSRGAIKQTSNESDATDALGTGVGDAAGVGLDGVIAGAQNAKS